MKCLYGNCAATVRKQPNRLTDCAIAAAPYAGPGGPGISLYTYNKYMPTSNRGGPWLILGICCMSLLIVGIDGTIVNVALPAIRRELHASLSDLQWSVDAYTLVIASFLMA